MSLRSRRVVTLAAYSALTFWCEARAGDWTPERLALVHDTTVLLLRSAEVEVELSFTPRGGDSPEVRRHSWVKAGTVERYRRLIEHKLGDGPPAELLLDVMVDSTSGSARMVQAQNAADLGRLRPLKQFGCIGVEAPYRGRLIPDEAGVLNLLFLRISFVAGDTLRTLPELVQEYSSVELLGDEEINGEACPRLRAIHPGTSSSPAGHVLELSLSPSNGHLVRRAVMRRSADGEPWGRFEVNEFADHDDGVFLPVSCTFTYPSQTQSVRVTSAKVNQPVDVSQVNLVFPENLFVHFLESPWEGPIGADAVVGLIGKDGNVLKKLRGSAEFDAFLEEVRSNPSEYGYQADEEMTHPRPASTTGSTTHWWGLGLAGTGIVVIAVYYFLVAKRH